MTNIFGMDLRSNHSEIEIEIVKGCLKNERKSQKEFFDRYKDAMYTVVYRILRDEAMASDALQEGFINAFGSLKNYRGQSSLGVWLKTIMVRSALRMINKQLETSDNMEALPDNIIEWDENLTGEVLDKAIAGLSPGYRCIFLLVEVDGYSHREVAEIMGISEGTSKSQLCRAKKHLQKKLNTFVK
jgi:RNA polymerase sigma factor (sigma-70 family)